MKAVCVKAVRIYVPTCDRDLPASEQTRFSLKHLTPRDEALLDNMLGSVRGDSMDMRLGDQALMALNLGLVGVENFFDSEGKPVELERESKMLHGYVKPIKDEILGLIPKDIRAELSNEIMRGSDIDEEELKN